jgi:hypothetical protein
MGRMQDANCVIVAAEHNTNKSEQNTALLHSGSSLKLTP